MEITILLKNSSGEYLNVLVTRSDFHEFYGTDTNVRFNWESAIGVAIWLAENEYGDSFEYVCVSNIRS